MERLYDVKLIDKYTELHNMSRIFQRDMRPWMELHRFENNEFIFEPGEEMDYFYFLVKGKLKIYLSLENGKNVLLRFAVPLAIVGDIELLGRFNVRTDVTAIDEPLLLGVPAEHIRKLSLNDPVFLRFVIDHLSKKLYSSSNTLALNLLYPLETRLASYLISITSDEHRNKRIEEIHTTNITEMANLLGTSYRHINRVLKNLCDKGILERNNKKLIIANYEELRKLSAELYE